MKLQRLMTTAAIAALAAGGAVAQTTDVNPDGAAQAPIVEPLYTSIDEMTVGEVIGTFVYSPDGDSIGEIDYVVQQGDGIAAVIGIGGFIGLGEYTVALPMEEFTLREDGISFELAAEKEALKEMPEFDESGAESLDSDLLIAELMPERESDGDSTAALEEPAPVNDTAMEETAGVDAEAEMPVTVAETAETVESELAETGEEIADSASEVGNTVEDSGEEVVAGIDSAVDDAEETMAETAENAETAIEEAGEEVAETADDMGNAIEETGEEVATAADDAMDDAETAIDEAGEEMVAEMPDTDLPVNEAAPSSIDEMTVGEVLGTITYDPSGNRIGEIDYVVAPASGPAAVIGIGGFIGLGEYTVALPIDQFKLSDDGTYFTLATDKETLKAQPEFDESGVTSVDHEIRIMDLKKLDRETASNDS